MRKEFDYMQNLDEQLVRMNRKALKHKDGKAWDNKKAKVSKMHKPRGKAYIKMHNIRMRVISLNMRAAFEGLWSAVKSI